MTSPNPFDARYRNKRRSPWAARVALGFFFILLMGAVLYWRDSFANIFWRAASPAAALRSRIESNQVADLKAELASTTAALADRNALRNENTVLKSLLGRAQTSTTVLAAVLMRPPGIPYDTLVVDVGSLQGVVAGDVVFGGGNSAIGEISDVYSTTARVSLFSAPGRSYDAQVEPKATPASVIPLSLEGQGAGSFSGQVPAGSAAVVGDSVHIPGIGNSFLGTITHIDASTGSSFETLFVQMPVDLFSLQYVEVQTHI